MDNTTTTVQKRNWAIYQNLSSLKDLYALTILDTRGIVDDSTALSEFAFKMNPKAMSLEEPAAAVITPTQDGGQFIEHQGQIYKNITISGTTGLRPNPKPGNTIVPILGIVNPFSSVPRDQETGLPTGERTGFEDLIDLRNLFRHYWDLKRDPDSAPYTIMMWQNGKENEFYIVEPMNFRTNRDSGSPLTFNYDIQLRTISKLDISKTFQVKGSTLKLNSLQSNLQKINNLTRQLTQAFTFIQSAVDRTASVTQATITSVLGPVNAILQGLTGVVTASQRFLSIPRNYISTVMSNCMALKQSIDQYRYEVNAFSTGFPSEQADLSNALSVTIRTLGGIRRIDSLFSSTLASNINQKSQAYTNPLTGAILNPDTSDLNSLQVGTTAGEATILDGEDIRAISKRLMGDVSYWKTLVLLNHLSAPYISPTGDGIDVLRPGDRILYPRKSSDGSDVRKDDKARVAGESSFANSLGRDLKLKTVRTVNGRPVFDFEINSRGDLARIAGLDNMVQAIKMRFATEQGQLPTHPEYGVLFPIGTKAKVRTLLKFHMFARASLLADKRVGSIPNLDMTIDGNTLTVRGTVVLKNSSAPLTVDFSVLR